MTSIYDKLKQLQYGEEYPFHMPGHKRNLKVGPIGLEPMTLCLKGRCSPSWAMIPNIQKIKRPGGSAG